MSQYAAQCSVALNEANAADEELNSAWARDQMRSDSLVGELQSTELRLATA
eukprot:SAG31_NODE_1240_length_9167_cov_4.729599_8_plen_51_part_00